MTLLVLGGNGQVGELLRALVPLGKVVATTRSGQLPDGSACETADFGQPDSLPALLDRVQPSVVVNAAAYTAVDRAEQDADAAFAANAQAPGVIARWCAAHGVPFVHYSTDYVFDGRAARLSRGRADRPAGRIWHQQARWRGRGACGRWPPSDLPHGVGVCLARRELPAHHAARGRRARCVAGGGRPDRHANAGRADR